jgi:hypothetical protein
MNWADAGDAVASASNMAGRKDLTFMIPVIMMGLYAIKMLFSQRTLHCVRMIRVFLRIFAETGQKDA